MRDRGTTRYGNTAMPRSRMRCAPTTAPLPGGDQGQGGVVLRLGALLHGLAVAELERVRHQGEARERDDRAEAHGRVEPAKDLDPSMGVPSARRPWMRSISSANVSPVDEGSNDGAAMSVKRIFPRRRSSHSSMRISRTQSGQSPS